MKIYDESSLCLESTESVATGESIGQVASQTMEGLIVYRCADRPYLDH